MLDVYASNRTLSTEIFKNSAGQSFHPVHLGTVHSLSVGLGDLRDWIRRLGHLKELIAALRPRRIAILCWASTCGMRLSA
jgi:hypothetical protein